MDQEAAATIAAGVNTQEDTFHTGDGKVKDTGDSGPSHSSLWVLDYRLVPALCVLEKLGPGSSTGK